MNTKFEVGKEYKVICIPNDDGEIYTAEVLFADYISKKLKVKIKEFESDYWFNIRGEYCYSSMFRWMVFLNDIPECFLEEPKANKSFVRGKVYKTLAGNECIFIKRFKTRRGIFGIFESDNEKRFFVFTAPIYRYNGVEVTFDYGTLDFIADESIRQLEIKKTDCKRIKE